MLCVCDLSPNGEYRPRLLVVPQLQKMMETYCVAPLQEQLKIPEPPAALIDDPWTTTPILKYTTNSEAGGKQPADLPVVPAATMDDGRRISTTAGLQVLDNRVDPPMLSLGHRPSFNEDASSLPSARLSLSSAPQGLPPITTPAEGSDDVVSPLPAALATKGLPSDPDDVISGTTLPTTTSTYLPEILSARQIRQSVADETIPPAAASSLLDGSIGLIPGSTGAESIPRRSTVGAITIPIPENPIVPTAADDSPSGGGTSTGSLIPLVTTAPVSSPRDAPSTLATPTPPPSSEASRSSLTPNKTDPPNPSPQKTSPLRGLFNFGGRKKGK